MSHDLFVMPAAIAGVVVQVAPKSSSVCPYNVLPLSREQRINQLGRTEPESWHNIGSARRLQRLLGCSVVIQFEE
jgi:hypothetical protein